MYALTIVTDRRTAVDACCAVHYLGKVEHEAGAKLLDVVYGEYDDFDVYRAVLTSEDDLSKYAGKVEWRVNNDFGSCTVTCHKLGDALDSLGCVTKFDTDNVEYEVFTNHGYQGMKVLGYPPVRVKATYVPMGNSVVAAVEAGVHRCKQKALTMLMLSVATTVERTLSIRKYGEREGLKRLHDLPVKKFEGTGFEEC